MSASDRQYVQPLLGYDWIAGTHNINLHITSSLSVTHTDSLWICSVSFLSEGILDVESSLEHSDEFFNNLLSFRSINQNECVHRQQEGSVVHNSHTPVHLDIVTGTRKPYMSKTITCQEMKKKSIMKTDDLVVMQCVLSLQICNFHYLLRDNLLGWIIRAFIYEKTNMKTGLNCLVYAQQRQYVMSSCLQLMSVVELLLCFHWSSLIGFLRIPFQSHHHC